MATGTLQCPHRARQCAELLRHVLHPVVISSSFLLGLWGTEACGLQSLPNNYLTQIPALRLCQQRVNGWPVWESCGKLPLGRTRKGSVDRSVNLGSKTGCVLWGIGGKRIETPNVLGTLSLSGCFARYIGDFILETLPMGDLILEDSLLKYSILEDPILQNCILGVCIIICILEFPSLSILSWEIPFLRAPSWRLHLWRLDPWR